MNRQSTHLMLAAALLWPIAAFAQPRTSPRELDAAVRAARDADLEADWEALVEARARVASWSGEGDSTGLVSYYLGYIDWRMSSLAYLVTGTQGMTTQLDRAVNNLKAAVVAKPTFGEAHALLATCAGILAGADRSRLDTLMPIVKTAWAAALEHGAANPRVQLLRAMTEVFVPPQYGGDRERGLERWMEAIRLFEGEQKRSAEGSRSAWGHAEAWAWLGGAYLTMGRHDDARKALETAVGLRPDFWWAAKAALPQARRPLGQ